jgi:hypothetical protein
LRSCPLVFIVLVCLIVSSCTDQIGEGGSHQEKKQPLTPLQALEAAAYREMVRRQPQVERLIANCMQRRGFRYVPFNELESGHIDSPVESDRERYGYGVIARLRHSGGTETSASPNPNNAIRASLRPRRRRAYDKALRGDESSSRLMRPISGGASYEVFPRSCVTHANSVVHGSQVRLVRSIARSEHLLKGLDTSVERDPRFRRARSRWSECMDHKGYAFSDPVDIVTFLEKRLAKAIRQPSKQHSGHDERLIGRAKQRNVERLKRLERSIASWDTECRLAVRMDRVVYLVRLEHESAFIENHPRLIRRVYGRPGTGAGLLNPGD